MNIYISGTPSVSSDILNQTVKYLNSFKGDLKFKKAKLLTNQNLKILFNSKVNIDSFMFNDLEKISTFWRASNEIDFDSYVVFLSDFKLDIESYNIGKKWFSFYENKDIVVKTYDWENYTQSKTYLAIAHQIIENLFQSLSGFRIKSETDYDMFHFDNHTVCINNFTIFEEQIKMKLLSGVVCEICTAKFLAKNRNNQYYFKQIDDTLEGIRKELKIKVKEAESTFNDVNVKEDGSIHINGNEVIFPYKYLHYIYLFFLINNKKRFTEKALFNEKEEENAPLISLIKAYNIVYGHGFLGPNLNKIPPIIKKRILARNEKKSTFNTYRNKINDFPPNLYGINSNEIEKRKFEFFVDIPNEKLQLPNSFLGFKC